VRKETRTTWTKIVPGGIHVHAQADLPGQFDSFRFSSLTLPSVAVNMYAGLNISGEPGQVYQVQYSTSLNPTNWQVLTNFTLPSSSYLFFDASSAGQPTRFYRAIWTP